MSNHLRMARALVRGILKPSLPLLGEARVPMRVALGDLDFNLHVTNSQYLRMMDVGRTDLILRNGLARAGWELRAAPVVGGTALRYKAELRARTRFSLNSRIVGWDEKWFYCEQLFRVGQRDYAVAVVKLMFHAGERKFAPREVLAVHRDGDVESPLEAPSVAAWADKHGL